MQDTKARYAKSKSSRLFALPFSELFATAILATGGITAYSLWQSSPTEVESNPVTNQS